jgi:hypothetical protein
MMAAMMNNARLPLMQNPFQAMLAQQQQVAAAQAALRMPNVSMAPNMFLNPLLMQTFGLGGLVPSVPTSTEALTSPKEVSTSNGMKRENDSKNGSTSTSNLNGHAPDSTSAHSSRSCSPVANDLSINGSSNKNSAANLNLLSQS